jgi:hypothetical protein
MTSTFDATAGQPHLSPQAMMSPAVSAEPVLDTLAMLGQAAAQQVPIKEEVVDVPGDVGIRLVCLPDISSRQLQTWQQRALPKHMRNSPNVSPLSMDSLVLAVATLVNTLLRVEVRDAKDRTLWHPVCDPTDGRPLGFNDNALLATFGAMDAVTALKKMFVRESDVVRASKQVMDASGWGDNNKVLTDDDVDDGTDPS